MAGAVTQDKYANEAVVSVVETAPNTLTFKKMETGMGLLEKAAWVISRIEYQISNLTAAQYGADADGLDFGLALSNVWTVPTLGEVSIVDHNILSLELSSAVGFALNRGPVIKDWAGMPGGGILLPPNPLYIYCKGTALTAATTLVARIWYTVVQLAAADYWELVEARRVVVS